MVFTAILPIYILVLIGFIAVKTGYISKEAVKPTNIFVVKIFVPALIFLMLFHTSESLRFDFILGYGVASLLVYMVLFYLLRTFFQKPLDKVSLLALGSASSNSIFIAFPVVSFLFPALADQSLSWILIVENMLLIPLVLILHDTFANRGKPFLVIARTLMHPIPIAIFFGIGLPILMDEIWEPLEKSLSTIRMAASGVSLVLIGGMLARSKIGGNIWAILSVCSGKLILHPLVTLAIFTMLGISDELLYIGVCFASISPFGVYANFCEIGGEGEFGATVFFFATLLAPLSIILWQTLVQQI